MFTILLPATRERPKKPFTPEDQDMDMEKETGTKPAGDEHVLYPSSVFYESEKTKKPDV